MQNRRLSAKIRQGKRQLLLGAALIALAIALPLTTALAASNPPPGQPLVNASDNMALNLANAPGIGRVSTAPPGAAPQTQPGSVTGNQALTQSQAQAQVNALPNTNSYQSTTSTSDNTGSGAANGATGGQNQRQGQGEGTGGQQQATTTITATTTTTDPNGGGAVNEDNSAALQAALAAEAARAAQVAANNDANRAANDQHVNERAYNSAVKGLFPMTPDQIKGVMQKMEETQNAGVQPSYGQPKPQVAVNTISLEPGAAPPEIDVAVGYVTTLTILDGTGQPWPIMDIGVGGNFDIPPAESGSPMIRITPLTRFGYGNLSVRLKDLATPITFRLSAGNDIVHYRYDARVPLNGPNAKTSLIQHSKLSAGDDVIMAVLDNAIPSGAKKMKVSGTDKRTNAYKVGDRTFVRTPLTMLSPSWDASVASADGMTVYETGDAPVVLLSDAGQLVRVHLTEQAVQ